MSFGIELAKHTVHRARAYGSIHSAQAPVAAIVTCSEDLRTVQSTAGPPARRSLWSSCSRTPSI
jgi:hypothetical protein